MNLMFRKNFSGEKTLSSSGGGGKARGALGQGRNAKRRDRERYSCMDDHHYRTHLFFSAPRSSAQYNDGGGMCSFHIGIYFESVGGCRDAVHFVVARFFDDELFLFNVPACFSTRTFLRISTCGFLLLVFSARFF